MPVIDLQLYNGQVTAVVKLLLEKDANVDSMGYDGDTALINASRAGCIECVQLLLNKGARVDFKNDNLKKALDLAQAEGHTEIVTSGNGSNVFKSYFSCQHPSYPNYLNLVAAQGFGSTSYSSHMPVYGAKTIVDVLDNNGVSYFVESGVGSNHHPFNQFYQITSNSTKKSKIVSSSQFLTDWNAKNLSAYNLYTSCCVEGQTAGGVPSLMTFLNSIGGVAGIQAYTGTLVQIVYDESGK